MKLIIVESPTKAKTIAKFLGKGYKIESSFGHIRDLPTSTMGIDIPNNYLPKYLVPAKAKKTVTKLKDLAKKADEIILASDEDREGEAIAWHLAEALKLKAADTKRIVFHEITKDAILHALTKPRTIDMKLVDAQQARRVLDRLVGYELSPFLWKKVARGLSAGRVQSVAVRLVVEREREIKAFIPEAYWRVWADVMTKSKAEFTLELMKIDGKKMDKFQIKNAEEAEAIAKELESIKYQVTDVEHKQGYKKAPAPFRTSTLQQTANRMLGMSAKQTMTLAQRLYEQGYITYMRTDSLNLSEKFITDAHSYLMKELGKDYCKDKGNRFKTKQAGAQEAHEAIRPTEAASTPEDLADKLEAGQLRLYRLIWQRSVASQMTDAVVDNLTVTVEDGRYTLTASGQSLKFDGYLKIYPEKFADIILPELDKGDDLDLIKVRPEESFTKPPARYSDATLVKVLEKHGIGRPSTYAPTISTIEARNYVSRDEDKRFAPSDIAFVVNDLLVEHFPQVVDLEFTADMEKQFDDIAEGSAEWQATIDKFYQPFHTNLVEKTASINKQDIMPEETSTEICDKCNSPMIIKTGRYGKFLACSNFPECKNIKGMAKDGKPSADDEKVKELSEKYKDEKCPNCGEPMIVKNGRFGLFMACTSYPKCKTIKNLKENQNNTGIACPKCEKGSIVAKKGKRGQFYACDNYPECKNAYWSKPTGEKCPECQSLLLMAKDDGVKCSNKECDFEK